MVNRLFSEKTFSDTGTSISTFCGKRLVRLMLTMFPDKHAESEYEGFSKSEIFGLGLQRSDSDSDVRKALHYIIRKCVLKSCNFSDARPINLKNSSRLSVENKMLRLTIYCSK
jgi:hypothetical protein